jgi:hypothetical protein
MYHPKRPNYRCKGHRHPHVALRTRGSTHINTQLFMEFAKTTPSPQCREIKKVPLDSSAKILVYDCAKS